jgi:hypothetical protein
MPLFSHQFHHFPVPALVLSPCAILGIEGNANVVQFILMIAVGLELDGRLM